MKTLVRLTQTILKGPSLVCCGAQPTPPPTARPAAALRSRDTDRFACARAYHGGTLRRLFSDNAPARAPLTKSPFCAMLAARPLTQNVACILCDVAAYPRPTSLPRGRPPSLATRSVRPRRAARLVKRPKMEQFLLLT